MIVRILTGFGILMFLSVAPVNAATMDELEARIAGLEQALERAEQERKKLEKILESASKLKLELKKAKREREKLEQDQKKLEKVVKVVEVIELPKRDEKATVVSLYGRFWPRVTYRDGKDTSTDITDALSRVGLKAESRVNNNLFAFMGGEWDIDLEQNGDWGDARLAYIGVEHSKYGYLAIGKQWDAHYRIVTEGSDIFYNRRSPYGFNEEGGFRSNNQIQYANRFGDIKLAAMLQVNGEACRGIGVGDRIRPNNAGDCTGNGERVFEGGGIRTATDPNHVDAASIGLAYDGPFYLGVSYLRANAPKGTASVGPDQTFYGSNGNLSRLGGSDTRRDFIGVGGRWQATDDLYLGFTYQYLRHFEGAVNPGDLELKQNRYTLDLLGTFDFGGGWKALVDVYLHDRDSSNKSPLDRGPSLIGNAVTLVKELNPAMDVFVEWVRDDFGNPTLVAVDENGDPRTADDGTPVRNAWTDTGVVNKFSLGFRYDFDKKIY